MRTTAVVINLRGDSAGREKCEMSAISQDIKERLTFIMDIKLVPGDDFQNLFNENGPLAEVGVCAVRLCIPLQMCQTHRAGR